MICELSEVCINLLMLDYRNYTSGKTLLVTQFYAAYNDIFSKKFALVQ